MNPSGSLSKHVWVTFQRKGYHFYGAAPDDVAYLRGRHRHLFKFRVKIQVWHEDREIEFHQFQNQIESWYDDGALDLDHRSCEMIADDLYLRLAEKYGSHNPRECIIEVSEDGECGAECQYSIPPNRTTEAGSSTS
jgi:hypothetical protein